MRNALRHRAPDDRGYFWDDSFALDSVRLRLSILDLPAEGHQPTVSASGRYVIVFNGEIFNLQEVKAELGAVPGRGGSELYPIMMSKDPVLRFRRRLQLDPVTF